MMIKREPASGKSGRPLIVCADDFGMNVAVNRAVLDLAVLGRLSATSCLVDGPCFDSGAAPLRETALQKGLHLNFTDDLGQPGLHRPLKALIRDAYLYRLDTAQVREQVVRQLDRFESVMGAAPDYVDGHLHVHQLPQIRDELFFELARRYAGKPGFWVRSTVVRPQPTMPRRLRIKARIIQRLGAKAMVRLAEKNAFATNPGFLGVYDFQGGGKVYASHVAAWLQVAQPGDVMMCHPERYHPDDRDIDPQRNVEFDVLAGGLFTRYLHRYGLCVQV
ncbi:MAG: ChbG/HpnK family deacetylase [Pusillimonas sp.]